MHWWRKRIGQGSLIPLTQVSPLRADTGYYFQDSLKVVASLTPTPSDRFVLGWGVFLHINNGMSIILNKHFKS